jgi:hypothetical protein
MDSKKDERRFSIMEIKLNDDDRLWRDQNFPNMTDQEFEKIVNTFGGNGNGNGKGHKQEQKEKQEISEIVYKYSNKGKEQLRESAIVEGKPQFIKLDYDKEKNQYFIKVESKIEITNKTLRSPLIEECPFDPYEFKTVAQAQDYLLRAMRETPDSLLQKIKSLVSEFNEVDDKTLNLSSLTIFNSYFQDRFSTIYYLVIVGANGTGKSVFGDTFECLGYRPVKVTNTTEAFYFRIFGINEFGQVTIIAEEFDKIDESSQTMAVLKEGYQPNSKVPRMTSDYSKMQFFCPFGFKIIISEKSPNENKARGFLDRSFKIKTYKGYPEYKIKEIRNPQGNADRQQLFNEITDLRNLLLAYRLLHINDPFKEIEIGLDGRDEELCKPTLQLLFTLGATDETIKTTESTFQYFLDIKNNRKGETLEAVIYPIVVNAVFHSGKYITDNSKCVKSISSSEIWLSIIRELDGNPDEKNPSIYYPDDFPKLYRPAITSMICDKFGAEIDHKRKGNNLLFDPDYLIKTGKIYRNMGKIKIKSIGDSVTHKSHTEPRPPYESHNEIGDSFNPPSAQGGISESLNHTYKGERD